MTKKISEKKKTSGRKYSLRHEVSEVRLFPPSQPNVKVTKVMLGGVMEGVIKVMDSGRRC